jgi:hypothetical protein
VLSAVSNETSCVFLHLLENPRLCDRNAVEEASDTGITDNSGGSASPANHAGKREHGRAQTEGTEGKEYRRRLTSQKVDSTGLGSKGRYVCFFSGLVDYGPIVGRKGRLL